MRVELLPVTGCMQGARPVAAPPASRVIACATHAAQDNGPGSTGSDSFDPDELN